jgi:hypothetical protein
MILSWRRSTRKNPESRLDEIAGNLAASPVIDPSSFCLFVGNLFCRINVTCQEKIFL